MPAAYDYSIAEIPSRPEGLPNGYDDDTIIQELVRCQQSSLSSSFGFVYWAVNYCRIYNNDRKRFVPFRLWDTPVEYDNQMTVCKKMETENKLIGLKSRQVGATTMILAYYLWSALFQPTAFVLLLSRGEKEAQELMFRIHAMHEQLPRWMRTNTESKTKMEWRMGNGSSVVSLSTRRGDSYSATHVLIDEAALLYKANTSLGQVLLNLAPTIGLNGKLFIISKVDKARPVSSFNTLFSEAWDGGTDYTAFFMPYDVVPGRDIEWYESQVETSRAIDGTLDYVYESYPRNPEEALAPKSLDKRLPYLWLNKCYVKAKPLYHIGVDEESAPDNVPPITGLKIYEPPIQGEHYILSADPAEGLTTSDGSAISVMKIKGKEQVAAYNEKVAPEVLGAFIEILGGYYNNAQVLFELNEHGRKLELWLMDNCTLTLLRGAAKKETQRKIGWTQNSFTKPLMYDTGAEFLRKGECIIRDYLTYSELSIVELSTLKAPKGMHDDSATVFMLNLAGIDLCLEEFSFATVVPR